MSNVIFTLNKGTEDQVDVTLDNIGRFYDGYCEEKELAGRHFSGNCTWDFDLTEESTVPEDLRGMYYLHGYADGDWGTEFSGFDFVSNKQIKENKEKLPLALHLSIDGEDKHVVNKILEDAISAALEDLDMSVELDYTITYS